jgi:hypothetical protein
MRWYQQREQGGSCMISLKNNAPSAEAVAISQAVKIKLQAVDSSRARAEGCV